MEIKNLKHSKRPVGRRRSTKRDLTEKVKLKLPEDYSWRVLAWLKQDLADYLSTEEDELLSQIIRDRDFASYQLLEELWGLQNCSITQKYDTTHISELRAKYQLSALLKKFQFDTDKSERIANAKEKFFLAEAACYEYNHSGYKLLCQTGTNKDIAIFTDAKSFLRKVLGEAPVRDSVLKYARHGPGSNLDTCNGQSNIYDKYSNWPYSCTQSAISYAKFFIASDKRWLGALENSYRSRFGIKKHEILNRKVFWENVLKVVVGNKITFVPKDARTERSIAIEPTMNLMLQLGVDGFIRKRLKRWDIDLDSQEKNQVLAFRGSIDPSLHGYATLDLSMASDTLSLKLCEMLLPAEWYSYLCKIRSANGCLGDDLLSYEKISSMGNGFTFALESAVFASLVYGAINTAQGFCDFKTEMSIFGDDIIIKRHNVDVVVRALSNAGFKLNMDKSFTSGLVTESCGTDWIQGKPVRPVFFKKQPGDCLDLFVDINRLKRILQLRWGVERSETVKGMSKWIPEQLRNLYGPYSDTDFDSYLHSDDAMHMHYVFNKCTWRYPRLIKKSVHKKGLNFLMRKLMHDLRDADENSFKDVYKRPIREFSTGGSRFTVYKSYSYTVGKTFSVCDIWQTDYNEDTAGIEFSPKGVNH